MQTFERLYNINAIENWAQNTLSKEELALFFDAYNKNGEIWALYRAQGKISTTPVFETLYSTVLNSTVEVQVGEKIVLAENVSLTDLDMHEDFKYWYNRYTLECGPEELANPQ